MDGWMGSRRLSDHVSKPEKVTGAETDRSARASLGIWAFFGQNSTDSGLLTHGGATDEGMGEYPRSLREKRKNK